jgi:hypothetical protein
MAAPSISSWARPLRGRAPHAPVHLHYGLSRRGQLLGRLAQGIALGDHHVPRRHDGHAPGDTAFLTFRAPSNLLVRMSGGSVSRQDVPPQRNGRQAGQELGPREKPGVG